MSEKDAMPAADKLKITNCDSAFGSISSIDADYTASVGMEEFHVHLFVRTCAAVPAIMSRTMVCFFFFCRWKYIQLKLVYGPLYEANWNLTLMKKVEVDF